VVALAVIVIAVTVTVRHAINPRVPDLKAIVGSPEVTSAEGAAGTALTQEFTQVRGQVPWLTAEAQNISDSCQLGSSQSGVLLGQATWSVDCQRQETLYYAFDGNLTSRLGELQHALTGRGWTNFSPVVGTSPIRQTGAPASNALMNADRYPVSAILGGTADGVIVLPGKVGLQIGWGARGGSVAVLNSLIVTGAGTGVNGLNYHVFEDKPVDLQSVASQSFRAHRYMVAISITVQYYENLNVPTPP
jgi:hypothetical protein